MFCSMVDGGHGLQELLLIRKQTNFRITSRGVEANLGQGFSNTSVSFIFHLNLGICFGHKYISCAALYLSDS